MEFGAFVLVLRNIDGTTKHNCFGCFKGRVAASIFRSKTSAWCGRSYGGERTVGFMHPPRCCGGGGLEFSALVQPTRRATQWL